MLFNSSALVSIVIPFYNAEKTLLAAIKSVFAQTYSNWELVLLDDGSTDGSLALAKSISDPRVKVWSDGVNRGLIFRLNQMLSVTKGDYIARMDADDMMASTRLERQMAVLLGNAAIDVVATGMAVINSDYRVVGVRDLAPLDLRIENVLLRGAIIHASIVARRDWFEKYPYRQGYERAEDRELFARTVPYTKYEKVLEPLYFCMESGMQSKVKLLKSYAVERKIIFEYAPLQLGFLKACFFWLWSYAKTIMIYLLDGAGYLDYLSQRRLLHESVYVNGELQMEVDRILNISLMGADDHG